MPQADLESFGRSSEFINFAVGAEQYGVDIMSVREIKEWSNVTHLPKQPEYVRGVPNLRGVIVPIVDLRCRFGQGLTEPTPLPIMIIVQIDGRHVGLIGAPRRPPPPTSCVMHENALIALIDLPNLLSADAGAVSSKAN